MDSEHQIASIRRPCCPRLSAATGECNLLWKSNYPRTLRVFIGFRLFFDVSIDCNMYIFSAALFELLCLFFLFTAAARVKKVRKLIKTFKNDKSKYRY